MMPSKRRFIIHRAYLLLGRQHTKEAKITYLGKKDAARDFTQILASA
jgi:hypothetical protein